MNQASIDLQAFRKVDHLSFYAFFFVNALNANNNECRQNRLKLDISLTGR